MKSILISLGHLLSCIFPTKIYFLWKSVKKYIYTGYFKKDFKAFGANSIINPSFLMLVGAKNISIGRDCYIGSHVQLTAWLDVNGQPYNPEIILGNNCSIGDDSHVSCINKIVFGDGVRLGKKILITDNSHGLFDPEQLQIEPNKRPMFSKGPIIIEDNVWIGEKASIMANVKIGKGTIVAANSVVTKDIPPYSLVAGCPARIIKQLQESCTSKENAKN